MPCAIYIIKCMSWVAMCTKESLSKFLIIFRLSFVCSMVAIGMMYYDGQLVNLYVKWTISGTLCFKLNNSCTFVFCIEKVVPCFALDFYFDF